MEKEQKDKLFMGLDVSTQGCKLVLLDEKNQIYTSSLNYDNDLPHYQTHNGVRKDAGYGVSESNPKMWVEAIHVLFAKLKKDIPNKINQICAISVSGQQHGLVTLQQNGDLSRNYSKLWNDFSTSLECKFLTDSIGGKTNMIKEISNTQRTGYTAPKILHMVKNEPQNWKATHKVLLVHNYINYILTGGPSGGVLAMEQGDVSGSALWNPSNRKWSVKICNLIDPDLINKLPPVLPCWKEIGHISKEFVDLYNFSPNCLIASGSGDNMMSAIGTGNYKEGIVTISLGTSGTAFTFMKKPFLDPDGEIASFCDATGNYLPLLCISNLANGYETILKNYSLTHEQFSELANKVAPGNKGRILCPWYEGERTPDLPESAPIYFGFKLEDFTKEIICRAVLEGHIMNLYEGFMKLPIQPKEIRLTGGISKSEIWRKTIANIFDCEVVQVLGEGAALGAAIHAAWTYYQEQNLGKDMSEIADKYIKIDEKGRVKPDKNLVEIYNDFKEIYFAVSKRIRGIQADNPFIFYKNFIQKWA